MAPSSKGTNPAPNYTVAMNRVQTQLEAQLRIVRSFMPSRPPAQGASHTTTATKPTPSFSGLASTSTSTSTTRAPLSTSSSKRSEAQQRQKHDEDSIFTETRAQDPNAGLGFGASSKRAAEREKERENQILRSRLLGRKRGAGDAAGRPLRRAEREESSDEEPGRSGLGRAKKRARREEAREEQSDEGMLPPVSEPAALESGAEKVAITPSLDGNAENDKAAEENGNGDVDMSGDQDATPLYEDLKPKGPESTSGQKSKKKRKKKKKSKSKEAELE